MLANQITPEFAQELLWKECLTSIKEKVGASSFATWFSTTTLYFDKDNIPYIEVPNQFFADFVEEHFASLIRDVLTERSINAEKLYFSTAEKDWQVFTPITEKIVKQKQETPKKVVKSNQFHPNYNFDRFVVGDGNRMAHAASLAVSEAPGKTSFNPLTIYGGTGLGKTHLLQAIGHFALTEHTADNVLYLTSQEFTNQYISYVVDQKDSMSFYKKFANIDLLLIDDIHFLSGKPGTQKEFFRIFNKLLLEKKQIVLSSDRSPEKIPDMMDHIINRFMGGLMADIQPPNLETRMAILRKKAEKDGLHLPEDVIQFIAGHVTSNVRELEGTLIKLIASASFTGKDISINVAQEVFGDVLSRKDQRISIPFIQKKVAEHYCLSVHQLSAHTRKRDVALPRAVAMFLCKKWTKQSLRTIGLDFGGRDYSTVIHACRKIETSLADDHILKNDITAIESKLDSNNS